MDFFISFLRFKTYKTYTLPWTNMVLRVSPSIHNVYSVCTHVLITAVAVFAKTLCLLCICFCWRWSYQWSWLMMTMMMMTMTMYLQTWRIYILHNVMYLPNHYMCDGHSKIRMSKQNSEHESEFSTMSLLYNGSKLRAFMFLFQGLLWKQKNSAPLHSYLYPRRTPFMVVLLRVFFTRMFFQYKIMMNWQPLNA